MDRVLDSPRFLDIIIDLDRAKSAVLVNIVVESIVYSNKNIKLVLRHCFFVNRFTCWLHTRASSIV